MNDRRPRRAPIHRVGRRKNTDAGQAWTELKPNVNQRAR
jgi:hypothetical protein